MLLKQALSEHAAGNETKAKELYESSIKEGIDKGAAFQNLGAIYKQEGKMIWHSKLIGKDW